MSSGKTERFTLSPEQFARVAMFALVILTLIVFSGAAVRLTSSGLGCPDWPRCYGKVYPPLNTHSIIEFGNRFLSGLVTLGVLWAAIGAMRRRPYRRDLAVWAWMLPLGAFTQAALGMMSVKSELEWYWVASHFLLSMVMMIPAVVLAWKARHEDGDRPRSSDAISVWSVRTLVPLTFAAVVTGAFATAAGPHAGGEAGEVARWEPRGGESLEWMVHRHGRAADLLGIAIVVCWLILWRRGAPRGLFIRTTIFAALVGVQGLIGSIQWDQQLPAELVWLHVALATVTWIGALWICFYAGRLLPAEERARAGSDRSEPTRAGVRPQS